MLVVELLGILLGLVLSLFLVDEVGAFGLGEPVGLTTGEGGDGLLSEAVAHFLACCRLSAYKVMLNLGADPGGYILTFGTLVVLVLVHGVERSGTCDDLMAQAGLVRVLRLLVVLLCVVYMDISERQHGILSEITDPSRTS